MHVDNFVDCKRVMQKNNNHINHVSDTALWVAAYRAEESERKDALFRDPLAAELIGPLGMSIATRTQGSRYTAWSVVVRTKIIDDFILQAIASGVDTVLNLGAGLDTRPYRLSLPHNLHWIEVDFSEIIEHKNSTLKKYQPHCKLERLSLDLSLNDKREDFFQSVNENAKKVLIITEGVVPYLTNEEASDLAKAITRQSAFQFWITEYYSPEILEFLRTPKRVKQMQKSPFKFYPENWFDFYHDHGWNLLETKYFGEQSLIWGRTPPTPGWIKSLSEADQVVKKKEIERYLGYCFFQKK